MHHPQQCTRYTLDIPHTHGKQFNNIAYSAYTSVISYEYHLLPSFFHDRLAALLRTYIYASPDRVRTSRKSIFMGLVCGRVQRFSCCK